MKKLIMIALASSALALTACGGSSDSSGSKNNNSHTNDKASGGNTQTDDKVSSGDSGGSSNDSNACSVSGTTVTATASGCTYSSPALNSGANITYKCTGGRVSSSMGMTANTINLNGMTVQCPA